uniref:Partial AB-hydrolase lipase domain-containing protein n=1 Tax=Sphenodon punctatus TaxID=8508 RepID=A0A8D0HK81_SPHPU
SPKMWWLLMVAYLLQGILHSEEFTLQNIMNLESEIIQYNGYPSEEYFVETEDGYILAIYRIPYGRNNCGSTGPKTAVFLQHAVLGDATHWISNLSNNSLGFILADAGYDVWLGNSRGNTWSTKHKTTDPQEQKFWEFSFDEMGKYDLPAAVYFILNKTEQEQMYYVAHSEGTATGFVALSTRTELAQKIKMFFALAPVATITFAQTPMVKMVMFGSKGVFHQNKVLKRPLTLLCTNQQTFCASVLSFVTGSNMKNMNMLFNFFFQRTPPLYKIEEVKIPVAAWSGGQDLFADPKDMNMLLSRIANLTYHEHFPEWQHLDFIWGLDATERMYMKIIDLMKKYP